MQVYGSSLDRPLRLFSEPYVLYQRIKRSHRITDRLDCFMKVAYDACVLRIEDHRSTKGQRTRRRIVENAPVLFNVHGVVGTSMADVSDATGLEKGGVYNHFASKEELPAAAFDYAAGITLDRIASAFKSQKPGLKQLRALLEIYRKSDDRPLLRGGCPLMNTAIEADDTNPELRRRARSAMESWRKVVAEALEDAMRVRAIAKVDTGRTASVFLATIEGGLMLAKLYGDIGHLRAAVDHLEAYLDSIALGKSGRSA